MDNNKLKIIELAQAGDKSALSELIKQEQNNIYTTLFYLKKNDNEINDIMQDVLLKLSLKITKLKNPLYFKSWLNQIIVNSYYDYLRKNKKKQSAFNLVKDEDESMQEVPDYTTNPQDSVLYTELDRIIKNSIQNLPAHYKIPIALREIQGLSYEEISNVTNTSIGTVKSRIARARSIIKENVSKYTRS